MSGFLNKLCKSMLTKGTNDFFSPVRLAKLVVLTLQDYLIAMSGEKLFESPSFMPRFHDEDVTGMFDT